MSADPATLPGFVRTRLGAVLGLDVRNIEVTHRAATGWVIFAQVADGRRAVVKVADGSGGETWFERTAAVIKRADEAGVPVPRVLAADDSGRPWVYLALEHVDGVAWRQLRPRLSDREVRTAHHQIGAALATLHSVRLPSFGELDDGLQPSGDDLLPALRRRAARRIRQPSRRLIFDRALDRYGPLFDESTPATLCHDDLHHENVVFRRRGSAWELAAVLDWDKAWAGPAESDCARVSFWDDMTGPGFWAAYPRAPRTPEQDTRTALFRLLWCLEYEDASPRHTADTAALRKQLEV